MSYEDKSGQTVNGALCTYSSLNNYNKSNPSASPNVPSSTASGCYVVPLWKQTSQWAKQNGYNNLVMSNGCSGYPSIVSAYNNYGMDAAKCNSNYGKRQCTPGASCN